MKPRGIQKTMMGTVVSDRMDKTRVVVVQRLVRHPLYQKYIRKRTRYKVHDEKNACHLGDRILIVETRPLSREKRWRVKEIVERAQ
ncbi:MAG TPA: 30S ribosomal protein S17 [Thermodesulfobacteriota bacterium]|nr:30S ribosomal protein S17 [Thermodesulfobacteriota bacterium]